MRSLSYEKDVLRRKIWTLMEEKGIARFPRPVFGRIPNFVDAEKAALRLIEQEEYQRAKFVKVNPDAPQHSVRFQVLSDGKTLLMPTPRMGKGFMVLNPHKIPLRLHVSASTIRGSFKYGRQCHLGELPQVDLIVAGSVAVSKEGIRIGKGEGYSEIEYAVLREMGAVAEETPIFTTVHDIQIVNEVPWEPHDLMVDLILTPTRTIRVKRQHERPKGIFWEKITAQQLQGIPILSELKRKDSEVLS